MNYLTEKETNTYVNQAKDVIEEKWQKLGIARHLQMKSKIEDICNYCIYLVFERIEEALKLEKNLQELEELEIEAMALPHSIENREMAQDIEDLLEKVGLDALAVLDENGNYFLCIDLQEYQDFKL